MGGNAGVWLLAQNTDMGICARIPVGAANAAIVLEADLLTSRAAPILACTKIGHFGRGDCPALALALALALAALPLAVGGSRRLVRGNRV